MRRFSRVAYFWCPLFILIALTFACNVGKQAPPSEAKTNAKREAGSASDQDVNGSSAVVKEYCDLEQKQQYAGIYALLSSRRKKYLEKYGVRNADQYTALRKKSEANWSEFVIDGHSAEVDGSMTYQGHAQIEESGAAEHVSFKCILVQENGTWKVDDWYVEL